MLKVMKSSILFTILKKRERKVGEKSGNRLLIQQNLWTQPMLSFSKKEKGNNIDLLLRHF